MTASRTPQNTDSIHRIAAAPGKTDRILPADATVRPKPKLLDQLREALRSRHYSRWTEQTYCHWVRRFIFFHNGLLPDHRMKADGGFATTGMRAAW